MKEFQLFENRDVQACKKSSKRWKPPIKNLKTKKWL